MEVFHKNAGVYRQLLLAMIDSSTMLIYSIFRCGMSSYHRRVSHALSLLAPSTHAYRIIRRVFRVPEYFQKRNYTLHSCLYYASWHLQFSAFNRYDPYTLISAFVHCQVCSKLVKNKFDVSCSHAKEKTGGLQRRGLPGSGCRYSEEGSSSTV